MTCLLLPCSYGGFFTEPSFAAPGRGPPEDEDAYARRIWQEMEKRKRQQSGDAAAAARSYFSQQTKAEAARQQAAFDAAQHSRQILEEEKAKDRAWREAVLKVMFSCLHLLRNVGVSFVDSFSQFETHVICDCRCSCVTGLVKFMPETRPQHTRLCKMDTQLTCDKVLLYEGCVETWVASRSRRFQHHAQIYMIM